MVYNTAEIRLFWCAQPKKSDSELNNAFSRVMHIYWGTLLFKPKKIVSESVGGSRCLLETPCNRL